MAQFRRVAQCDHGGVFARRRQAQEAPALAAPPPRAGAASKRGVAEDAIEAPVGQEADRCRCRWPCSWLPWRSTAAGTPTRPLRTPECQQGGRFLRRLNQRAASRRTGGSAVDALQVHADPRRTSITAIRRAADGIAQVEIRRPGVAQEGPALGFAAEQQGLGGRCRPTAPGRAQQAIDALPPRRRRRRARGTNSRRSSRAASGGRGAASARPGRAAESGLRFVAASTAAAALRASACSRRRRSSSGLMICDFVARTAGDAGRYPAKHPGDEQHQRTRRSRSTSQPAP